MESGMQLKSSQVYHHETRDLSCKSDLSIAHESVDTCLYVRAVVCQGTASVVIQMIIESSL